VGNHSSGPRVSCAARGDTGQIVLLESGPFPQQVIQGEDWPSQYGLVPELLPVCKGWQMGRTRRVAPYGDLGGGRIVCLAWYPQRTAIALREELWSGIPITFEGQGR